MIYEQSLIVIGSKVLKGITKDKFEAIYHKTTCLKEFSRAATFNVLNTIFKIDSCVFLHYSVTSLHRSVAKMLQHSHKGTIQLHV